MTHVIVDVVPAGQATFARAHADVFRRGELTVTWADDDTEARVFAPGTWQQAVVLDEENFVVSAFKPNDAQAVAHVA